MPNVGKNSTPHKNIFLQPIAVGSKVHKHYKKTILEKIPQSVVIPHLDSEQKKAFSDTFGADDVSVWGSTESVRDDGKIGSNRRFFDMMKVGDYFLFTQSGTILVSAQIAFKCESDALSREFWPMTDGKVERLFNLIYFVKNVRIANVPFANLFKKLGYKPGYSPQGLTRISDDRLKAFDETYGSFERCFESEQK